MSLPTAYRRLYYAHPPRVSSVDGMEALAVRLSGITRRFGAVRAVDDLDLTIEAGTVVALLGPNGAGKTTTISIMLGLAPARHRAP